MSSTTYEICRFHPATLSVSVVEDGVRLEVPVCEVHKRAALAEGGRAWTPARVLETSAPKNFA